MTTSLITVLALIVSFLGSVIAALSFGFILGYRRNRNDGARPQTEVTPTPRSTKPDPATRPDGWREYISDYTFPTGVLTRALARCPRGTRIEDIDRGLRQFFLACGSTPTLNAAMPSKTVDEAWHEFLTYTRNYATFCENAFGQMLHHIPEVTMTTAELGTNHGTGMTVAWTAACEDEGIPVFGDAAPALFAADTRSVANRLIKPRPAPPTYVGSCTGTENSADDPCVALSGTVCMLHSYTSAFRASATLPPAAPRVSTTKSSSAASTRSAPRSSSRTRRSSSSTTSSSAYDAAAAAALLPIIASDPSCGGSSSSSSHSSCGGSSSSSSHSSCGGSSSSSSSSSCGGGSSSCGGG